MKLNESFTCQNPTIFEHSNIPICLDNDKYILNLNFYVSNKIIEYTKNIDHDTLGFAVGIIFECKFIYFEEC